MLTWILKSRNLAGNPSFCIIRAYFRAANLESSSLFAPVQTILPELNINAVVLGSLILIITAANRLGLYSALRACNAIFFKSNLQFKFTVDTMFLQEIKNVANPIGGENTQTPTVVEELYQDQQNGVSWES